MMKLKAILLPGLLAVSLIMIACKPKREGMGDEQLKKGQLKNAMMLYQKQLRIDSGAISDEFYDNYSLTLIRSFAKAAKTDVTQGIVLTYFEEIPKYLNRAKKQEVVGEYVDVVIKAGNEKLGMDDYQQETSGLKFLRSAVEFAKKQSIKTIEANKALADAEAAYSKLTLGRANGSDDPVVTEYYLLAGEVLLPTDATIKEALVKIRKKNLNNFLIWGPDVNGVSPAPGIDVNQYVIAFRKGEVSHSKKSLRGAVQLWNTSGNSTKLSKKHFTLIGQDGSEIANTAKISKDCVRFDTEKDCSTRVSFKFNSSFKISHLLVKNPDGAGKKYLSF